MNFFGISLCILLIYGLYKGKKAMHMLQQNYYDESNRYLLWISKNKKKVFCNLDILFLIFCIFLFLNFNSEFISGFCVGLYIVIFIFYIKKVKKEQVKKPLVVTTRIKRLFVTESIIYLLTMN